MQLWRQGLEPFMLPIMFDSHAHMLDAKFDADRDGVIKRAFAAGLTGWMEVGTTPHDSARAIALAEQYDGAIASVGVHPDEISDLTEENWTTLRELATHEVVRAIGEVGIDYYRVASDDVVAGSSTVRAQQLAALERFRQLAQEHDLPMIFHVRDGEGASAHDDVLSWLAGLPANDVPRGVIHTFSGTAEQAERYLAHGLYLSFSGVVTFKNAGEITEVARTMPLDRMLVETDCPYLAPIPHRGLRNEPAYVQLVAEHIASIRDIDVVTVAHGTDENVAKLFGPALMD